MTFSNDFLSDLSICSVGRLDPCSDHEIFASALEMFSRASSMVRSLDGTWKASLDSTPGNADDTILRDSTMDAYLVPVTIPGEFQLQYPEWDKPQYVNVQYPWDGHEELSPPQCAKDNPTVTCVRNIHFSAQEMASPRIILTIGAAEAAVAVFLNGSFVGYAEDAFTPHRFDLKPYAQEGENRLCLRVFKRTAAAWICDQDFWRFSGIHRSVTLTFERESHLEDMFVRTPLTDLYTRARLELDLTVLRPTGHVRVCLLDAQEHAVIDVTAPAEETMHLSQPIPRPHLWSHEDPYLYTLVVLLTGEDGHEIEASRTMVGVRAFEMIDRVMCLNGRRIVFHGANRHEFDTHLGRVQTEDVIRQDILQMKKLNINAVRTCHYPNHSLLYRLCDEYGLYVIDETNLESHGSWSFGHPEDIVPGDRPEWLKLLLYRGRNMQERDKNHACILLWSCGNESYGGKDIYELSEMFRHRDPTRLVHYEGVTQDPRYPDTTDVFSRMYCKAADIEAYLQNDPKKPFINCEYTHAMGNSCGGIGEYTDLEDRYPMYQGGFIWDYIDQGLTMTLPDGRTRLAYGGDFTDRPTDWNFIANGIILSDRTPSPKAQEVACVFRDVDLIPDRTGIQIRSRRLFAPLCDVRVAFTVLVDRKPCLNGACPVPPVVPGSRAHVDLALNAIPFLDHEVIITARLLTEKTHPLGEGACLSVGQTVFGTLPETTQKPQPVTFIQGRSNLGVKAETYGAMLEKGKGLISLTNRFSQEMLECAPMLSLFRAPTDNDVGNGDALRQGIWHAVSRYSKGALMHATDHSAQWNYTNQLIPDMDLQLTYTAMTDGMHVELSWRGVQNLPDMPCLGLSFLLDPALHRISYFGMGPEENYVDRARGAVLGWYTMDAREGLTPYIRPQESGNRMGVDMLRITDDEGCGLEIRGENLEITAHPYLPEQLAAARHPDELPHVCRTVLDIALFRKGVGGDDSWGAPVLPKFTYPSSRSYTLSFVIKPIDA
ncbi:MAG: beta-galactosidase [Clostridia bacterium]|nr:beta-galactosidase [Clostridia bacterium]